MGNGGQSVKVTLIGKPKVLNVYVEEEKSKVIHQKCYIRKLEKDA